jgi:hypothetical protein
VACLLKGRFLKPLLRNGSANMLVARQWLSVRNASAATDTFSLDNWLRDAGEAVSPPSSPGRFLVLISVRG